MIEQVAPIQLAIRLLVTNGFAAAGAARHSDGDRREFDPASLTWPWRHPDPRVDALQEAVMHGGRQFGASRSEIFEAIRAFRKASDSSERVTRPST